MRLSEQITYLFLLAMPISCVAWTVTHEEVFREPREFCIKRSKDCATWWQRKFFYLFTCEYCFSHYVVLLFLFFTRYHLLYADWRGYVVAGFGLVWVANVYMSVFARIRVGMKKEKMQADLEEVKLKDVKEEMDKKEHEILDLDKEETLAKAQWR